MAYINLLPWREEAKEVEKKVFLAVLASIALVSLLITFLVGTYYQLNIDGQNSRNQFLQSEIAILDIKISEIRELNAIKKDLEKRILAVKQLQSNRNVGTQVFSEITNVVSNGVYLTNATKTGDILAFEGKSETNNNLANMIRNIEDSELLYDAQLNTITSKNTKNNLLSDFNMVVRIKNSINEASLDKINAKEG